MHDISNFTKNTEKEGVYYYNPNDFGQKPILKAEDLNKSSIENTLLEYIYRDQNGLIENNLEISQKWINDAISGIYRWITKLSNDTVLFNGTKMEEKIGNLSSDPEQELIDEINKTIIEDELKKNQENKTDNNNKNLKHKRRKNMKFGGEEELGFNKKIILFPLYIIIYTILYCIFYKYVLMKFSHNKLYTMLPSEDLKMS